MKVRMILWASLLLFSLAVAAPFAVAKQFYASNFEKDALGSAPKSWELGFKGAGTGKVIADPLDPNNKVFAHSDLAKDKARHDVGGNIWVVGDASWQDYIVEYDAYFPEDFYMGTLCRFNGPEKFYLFDRRSAGELGNFDLWKRENGAWTRFGNGKFDAKPKQWYRFRLVAKGDTIQAYGKATDDNTPFDKLKPLMEGKDGTFKAGKFGLYGLIYVDNVVIGETGADLTLTVEPGSKLAATWGEMKQ